MSEQVIQPPQTTDSTDATEGSVVSERVRNLLRRYAYGSILLTSLLVLWWGVEGPFPLEIVSNALYIAVIFVVLSLEFVIPFRKQWGDLRKLTRADAIYFLAAGPIDYLHVFLLIGVLSQTAPYHHLITVFDIWPDEAHILVQLFMLTLVVDFFKYWYHRWTHEWPWLWRIHSVHHSIDRLEMLRASYFYPIDIFLTVAVGTLAMLMVGAPYELIIFHNVFAGITGLLNHSNADVEAGWLDHILNSPGHHRAHHSVGLPGSHSNYGSFFNFVDRIFGTRYLPEDRGRSGDLGLDETYDFPETVLQQLAVPFRWRKVHRDG